MTTGQHGLEHRLLHDCHKKTIFFLEASIFGRGASLSDRLYGVSLQAPLLYLNSQLLAFFRVIRYTYSALECEDIMKTLTKEIWMDVPPRRIRG